MQLLPNFFRKKSSSHGIISISFLSQGMAIALSEKIGKSKMKLIHCEFIHNEQDPKKALNKLVAKYDLKAWDCHLILTADKYQHINIEKPSVAEEEMLEAIRWKIGDFIDFPADTAALDSFPSPQQSRNDESQMLEVIASSGDIIDTQIERCKQAGLQLKVIDIEETVLRNLAFFLPHNTEGVALLYLLEFSGSILIQKAGMIYLSRKIDIGYQQLDLDAQLTEDSPAALAQYKLALEIQRSLDYVESYYNISPISNVAVIPWAENTQILINNLNGDYGLIAYRLEINKIITTELSLDYTTQLLCAPTIGGTLRYVLDAA